MENNFAKNIRLKRSREYAGISQEDFALRVGSSQAYIAQVETSKTFSHKKAVIFSKVLGIDPDWLMTGQGHQFPDEARKESLLQEEPGAWLINSGPAKYSISADFEEGSIYCKSLTDKHPDFEISIDELFRVFSAIKGIKTG